MEKIKKIIAGLRPAPPQRDSQNLCLQGKWMALTLRLAFTNGKKRFCFISSFVEAFKKGITLFFFYTQT